MRAELGVDGGSNRDWQALAEVLPSTLQLVPRVLDGLQSPQANEDVCRDFMLLLEEYAQNYPEAFAALRASTRRPNAELVQSIKDSQSTLLRFSRAFVEGCAAMVSSSSQEGSAPSLTDLIDVLPVDETLSVASSKEAKRFLELTGAGLTSLESLYAVAIALYLITQRLVDRGLLELPQGPEGSAVLHESAAGWAVLLASLSRRAVELLCQAPRSEDDVQLLVGYCKDVGLWLKSRGGQCTSLVQVAWSTETDPMVRYVAALKQQGGAEAVVLLDADFGDLGAEAESFFSSKMGVAGQQSRRRLMEELEKGLTRWAEHKGPMPRDVEDMYKAVAGTAEVVWGQGEASEESSSQGVIGRSLGLEELPVVTLDFEFKTVGVKRDGGGTQGSALALLAQQQQPQQQPQQQQPLVGVAGAGDPEDGALSWLYREKFSSRCLHPAILSLLKHESKALVEHLVIAPLKQTFLELLGAGSGSMLNWLRVMGVDIVKVAQLLSELYPEGRLPITELARYWANLSDLKDVVIEGVLTPGVKAPGHQELVEAIKRHLNVPVVNTEDKGGAELVNLTRSASPLYLGSILGIDLETQDKKELPRCVKHPSASRDTTWHRATRADDGLEVVVQSIIWERFLLAVGVKPLGESHIQQLPASVVTKVYLSLAKFNSMLNSRDHNIPNKAWACYSALYDAVDGNAYFNRYKELFPRSSTQPQRSPSALASQTDLGGLVAPASSSYAGASLLVTGVGPYSTAASSVGSVVIPPHGYYDPYSNNVAAAAAAAAAVAVGGSSYLGSTAASGGGSSMQGAYIGGYSHHPGSAATPSPFIAGGAQDQQAPGGSTAGSVQAAPQGTASVSSLKRHRSTPSDGSLVSMDSETPATKTPRLMPPAPKSSATASSEQPEEGEIEEGEIR